MRPTRRSFTLLEMMLVIAVLAVVAGTVISSIGDAEERAYDDLALAELVAVRDAVRRFRADTGFFPKTGPFGLRIDRNNDGLKTDDEGGVEVPTSPPPGFTSVEQWIDWFESPANLEQLFVPPAVRKDHPTLPDHPLLHLATWNPDRGRGWNGPYLTRAGEGWVQVGDGTGGAFVRDPSAGNLLPPMLGVADCYARPPLDALSAAPPQRFFQWWVTKPVFDEAVDRPFAQLGRPILLMDLAPDPGNPDRPVRVVGFGKDGLFPTLPSEDHPSDDLEIEIPR